MNFVKSKNPLTTCGLHIFKNINQLFFNNFMNIVQHMVWRNYKYSMNTNIGNFTSEQEANNEFGLRKADRRITFKMKDLKLYVYKGRKGGPNITIISVL